MEATKIHQGIKDLTKRLFSTDPIEYNSAINQYVEPSAAYTSDLVRTQGSSKIKKVLLAESWFIADRKVDEEKLRDGKDKVWDESVQLLTIPTLTTYTAPFALPLISLAFTFPSTLILHLHPNSDPELDGPDDDVQDHEEDAAIYSDDGTGEEGFELTLDGEQTRRYLVTKWVESGWVEKVAGKGGLLGFLLDSLIRPLITLLILTVAALSIFHKQHPLSNGIIPFFTAAVAEVWIALQRIAMRGVAEAERAGGDTLKNVVSNGKTPKPIQRTTSSLLADHVPKHVPSASTSSPVTSPNADVDTYAEVVKDPPAPEGTHVHPAEKA